MYNTRTTIALCLAVFCSSIAMGDQVVMKNGDRVTGSVVKKTGNEITIKTEQFGVVTTSWEQVQSVIIDKPVSIVLQDGNTVQGTLATTDAGTQVTTAQQKVTVAPAQIETIRDAAEEAAYERLLHPGWGQLWAGTASIGFAGTSGNAKTLTFTTGVNAARVTNTDKTTLYFNTIKATARVDEVNSATAQAVRGGIGYDHNVSPRLFVNAFNDYEYDRFQDLDLRFVIGGGLGFHALKTERMSLDALAGADFNRSSFSTPLVRQSAEFYWGDDYALKLTGATSLVQSFRMFNDLTNTGTYRMNFDVGATTRIAKWMTWNLSLSDRYLSFPAPGRKANDFLYTTGVGITFSK